MNFPRIVITGIECITPAGSGKDALLSALKKGKSLTSKIDSFCISDLPPPVGVLVPDFDAKSIMNVHQIKRLDKSGQFFLAAGKMAINDSQIMSAQPNLQKTGIFEGSSLGGLNSILDEHSTLVNQGPGHINPFMIIKGMNGIAGSLLAMEYKINGPVLNFSNGSVSSASAIYSAFHMLRAKEIDVAIAGGSEAPINYNIYSIFGKVGAMCPNTDNPEKACRPFDISRSGLILGEGGGCIVMERLDDALRRKAHIYAEISGVAMTNDAYNPVAPEEDAIQQSRCVQLAIDNSKINIEDIGFIASHGTSTILNDRIESVAINKIFGEKAQNIPVTAMKSILGHSLGACTIIEMIGGIMAMNDSFVPMIANLEEVDPQCNLSFVMHQALQKNVKSFLIKNSSFGGKNTAIVIRKF
ncbi:MAG: beta-ketoacyl-[acyl-carrier-protein] synthase family protein [Saprospiraceae bacterium]|jgi:3-oxoacyl-[acyl-carrier-protein] synthase II|nr:beta-ketoacyl-[acyl-carrier-protein] synthase family protein [Saprospiraceae bacterium]